MSQELEFLVELQRSSGDFKGCVSQSASQVEDSKCIKCSGLQHKYTSHLAAGMPSP